MRELRIAAGILPLLYADWKLPWLPLVSCSDAAESGFACHEAVAERAVVRAIGAWSERWRFMWGAGNNPRQLARGETILDANSWEKV